MWGVFFYNTRRLYMRHLWGTPSSSVKFNLFYFGCAGFSLCNTGFSGGGMWAQLPRGTWDLCFPTRDRTCIPCIGRQIFNHGATRKSLSNSALIPGMEAETSSTWASIRLVQTLSDRLPDHTCCMCFYPRVSLTLKEPLDIDVCASQKLGKNICLLGKLLNN